jgi:hypothetical protein
MDSYISDFQNLSMLVIDIFERRLIVLFIDGLFDPLKGWIKAFNSPSFQEAIKKARDMETSAFKNKFQSNDLQPEKEKY